MRMNYQVWGRSKEPRSKLKGLGERQYPVLRRYEDSLLGLHVETYYLAVVIRRHSWTRYPEANKPGPVE